MAIYGNLQDGNVSLGVRECNCEIPLLQGHQQALWAPEQACQSTRQLPQARDEEDKEEEEEGESEDKDHKFQNPSDQAEQAASCSEKENCGGKKMELQTNENI